MVATGTVLGQYRIVRRIGAGGMAEVFLAQKTGAAGFTRQSAIKTILAAGAPQESIGLFLDEARVASGLSHPAIVQTLDLGFENETLFIAMEYVPGPPLSRVIQELKQQGRPTLTTYQVAYIGARVASALDFAHRRAKTPQGQPLSLVHRDVSPQNILVSRDGLVKLMDFGVARASIQMHKTRTGQVRGKAAYMAPEQVRAHTLDGRTDMFALGLVLYEALTAWRPYQRNNEISSMRAIISEDVPPIRERNPQVPERLAEIIHQTLRRPAADRYEHCGALEEALMSTLGSHHPTQIEHELADVITSLFGPLSYADALPEVEAWQPTMASTGSPVTPQFKVPGSGLSPTVAAMLGQLTPSSPTSPRPVVQTPSGATAALPHESGSLTPGAMNMGYGGAPGSDPYLGSQPLVQGVHTPGSGFVTDAHGSPVPFPGYQMTPSGAHPGFVGTPPGVNTPFVVTSPSTIIDSPRAARWIWGMAALLIVLSAVVLGRVLTRGPSSPVVESLPSPTETLGPRAVPGAPVAAPEPADGPRADGPAEVRPGSPADVRPGSPASEPTNPEARPEATRASPRPSASTPRPSPSSTPARTEAPRATAEASPRAAGLSPGEATTRARALASRAKAAGNDALAQKLNNLSIRILEGGAVGDDDLARLREAEKELGGP